MVIAIQYTGAVWGLFQKMNIPTTLQEALREECVKLAAVVAAEQERERTGNPSPDEAQQQQGDADTPAADPLDAFMSNVASSIEHDKVR